MNDYGFNMINQVILRVYLDSTSQQSIEVPITPNTTCRDIINCCEQEQNCHLAELWRGCERPVNDEERPFEILQQWGQHKHEVRFYLRHETPLYSDGHYDQVSDTRRNGIGTYDLTEPPQVPNDLSLSELQEMAVRQQQQIESQQQQLVAKEQRLKFLRQQEQKHQQMASENERLRKLREKVEAQELKLKKLRALRGQLDQHKTNNGSLTIELESIKAMFNEKEKELTLAVAKVEELHRQMEELKKGRMNGLNTSRSAAAALELERLRNELMMRNKLNSEQTEKINKRREYYNEKTNEVQLMDRRIEELQQRLRKKRSLQQEQSSNQNLPPRRPMNRPAANSNIAAVEPYIKVTPKEIKTTEDMYSKEFIPNKQDPKYQSLPSHTINKKPDPVKPGGESAPVIYDMKVDDTTVNGLKKGDNNNIPNYNPTQNKVKPVAQSLANFVARPFGSTSSTAFTGRVLNISTLEPRTAGSGQSSPAISDSSLTQYPPSTTAPSSQFTHSTPDMARPSHVAAPVSTSTKPVLSAGPAVPRSPMSSSKPPEVSPIYGNNTPTLNSYQSTPVSSNTVQSRPQVAASSPAPSSPVTKTIDVPPPLEPRGVAPVRPSIASSPSAKNPPSVTSAGPTPDTSVTSVNSALSMLMGNSTTSTPPKTTSTYRYASRSAISNLYMNKMGSSAMDQYRMNMNRLYSNTSQKQDTTSDLSQQQNSPTPKLPPKASSPTKPSPGDRPVSPLKAGSPIRSIPPGGFDPIDKAHFKPHTPKALHRRHSAGDSDDSAMKALARAAQQAQSDQQENNANNNNNHNGALRRTLFEKIPEKEVPVESKKPVARMTARKTNLKSKSSKPKKRRVSFDPLALLLDASLEGELDLVKKTATQVDNPSEPNDEGITALHNAICAGHYEIVKFLVEFGCDVNSPDSDGWTPLHCAASCNNLPMVKLLVEHGACIFATTISDQETAAEKCEEDEDGFDGCSEYLYSIQEKLGIMNGGAVFSVFDYQANNNDEISFKEGDKLVVLRKGDETEKEWWWARRKDREGYIPRNLLGLQPRVKPVNGALNSPE